MCELAIGGGLLFELALESRIIFPGGHALKRDGVFEIFVQHLSWLFGRLQSWWRYPIRSGAQSQEDQEVGRCGEEGGQEGQHQPQARRAAARTLGRGGGLK